MVSGPEPPDADLTLVATEVTGVVAAEERAEVAADEEAAEDAAEEACEADVGELPLEPEVARPVTVEMVGFEEASFEPMVAYAVPSWRLKNGRGSGCSLQQSTLVASALQHHWLLWFEHCVIDSPPPTVMLYVQRLEAQPGEFQSLSVQLYLPWRPVGG